MALELDPSEFGGVTLRITGATELRDAHGREGVRVIASFGRWSDEDMAFLYSCVTAAEQLDAMTQALGSEEEVRPELETVLPGWNQPELLDGRGSASRRRWEPTHAVQVGRTLQHR